MTRMVGLVGGMSWKTTALYYQEINQHVSSKLGGLHSANLLIRSIDYDAIARSVSTGDIASMTQLICASGQELKCGNVEALALCANVAHKASEALERRTGLPVLHIVDFAGREIVRRGFKKVGVLATKAVMEEDFYTGRMREQYGLEVAVPDDKAFRDQADHQIFNEMSKAVISENVKAAWKAACDQLVEKDKVDCVVLACTELRFVLSDESTTVPVLDATLLHARGIADWTLGSE